MLGRTLQHTLLKVNTAPLICNHVSQTISAKEQNLIHRSGVQVHEAHLLCELAGNLLGGLQHWVDLRRGRGGLQRLLLLLWLRCSLRHELGRHFLRQPHLRLRLWWQILQQHDGKYSSQLPFRYFGILGLPGLSALPDMSAPSDISGRVPVHICAAFAYAMLRRVKHSFWTTR